VKITLKANTPQILAQSVKRHKIIMGLILGTLITLLITEAVLGFYLMNGY